MNKAIIITFLVIVAVCLSSCPTFLTVEGRQVHCEFKDNTCSLTDVETGKTATVTGIGTAEEICSQSANELLSLIPEAFPEFSQDEDSIEREPCSMTTDCSGGIDDKPFDWHCTVTGWYKCLNKKFTDWFRKVKKGTININGRDCDYRIEGGFYRWKWKWEGSVTDRQTGRQGHSGKRSSATGALEESSKNLSMDLGVHRYLFPDTETLTNEDSLENILKSVMNE